MNTARITGLAAIALGIGFNIPYALLAAWFDYPAILRQPAATVLDRFSQGGAPLVLAWFAFMMAALALVPLACALALQAGHLRRMPGVAMAAAITGSLAGVLQAIGLSRWVFAVPAIIAAGPDAASNSALHALLNGWGGVGIGEFLGQWCTMLFLLAMAGLQKRAGRPAMATLAQVSAAAIALGTLEGLMPALGRDGGAFSLATIAGFAGLSIWLVATGAVQLRSTIEPA